MKKIQNNLYYFKISQNNPENILDDFYIFNEKHPQLEKYIANTKEIKNILITIKTLRNKNEDRKIVEKYFLELSKILGRFSVCSEFACFINTCDSFLDFVKKDSVLLKKITERYFDKRVLNEKVPDEWIQAILDSHSARKKGKCGENKLVHILKKQGFKEVFNWNDFFKINYCVIKFSKKFSLENARENLGVKIKTKKQNKTLDLIIKAGDKILLCEAKHLNTSGGGQNKQIAELIEIVSLKEENKNIFYIAFLDGSYSNILLGNINKRGKLKTQQKEINKYLLNNRNNFWVNTAGFKDLFFHLRGDNIRQ